MRIRFVKPFGGHAGWSTMSIDEHIFRSFVQRAGSEEAARERIRAWAEQLCAQGESTHAGLSRLVLRKVWDECCRPCKPDEGMGA